MAIRQRSVPTRRAPRHETGATAVEFALVFGFVLVPLVMGLLQFGWYFYTSQVAGSAARETARRIAVGDCLAAGEARQFGANQANLELQPTGSFELTFGTPGADGTVTATMPAPGQTMRVRVDLAQDAQLFEFFPLPDDGAVVRTVDTRVEDDTQDSPCT